MTTRQAQILLNIRTGPMFLKHARPGPAYPPTFPWKVHGVLESTTLTSQIPSFPGQISLTGYRRKRANLFPGPLQNWHLFLVRFSNGSGMNFNRFWMKCWDGFRTYSQNKTYIFNKCFRTGPRPRTPAKSHAFWKQKSFNFDEKSVQEQCWFQSRNFIDFVSLLEAKMTAFWRPLAYHGLLRSTLGIVQILKLIQRLKYWQKVIRKSPKSPQTIHPKSLKWCPEAIKIYLWNIEEQIKE